MAIEGKYNYFKGYKMKFQDAIDLARLELKKIGNVQTRIIFEINGHLAMAILAFDNQDSKTQMQKDMREQFNNGAFKNVQSYVLVSEGWFAKEEKPDQPSMPSVRPGLRVDRKECLLACEYFRDSAECNLMMQEFTKDRKNKITLKKPEFTSHKDQGASRMNFFSDWDTTESEMISNQKKLDEAFMQRVVDIVKKESRKEFDAFLGDLKSGKEPDIVKFKELVAKIEEVGERERKRVASNLYEDIGAD